VAVKKLIWHEAKLSAILLFASRSRLLAIFPAVHEHKLQFIATHMECYFWWGNIAHSWGWWGWWGQWGGYSTLCTLWHEHKGCCQFTCI